MPSLVLKYLDSKGRAEFIRLALKIGDVPFEDVRVSKDGLAELKASKKLPFEQVPLLTIDGATLSQSNAIARYCGKLTGLYPKGSDEKSMYQAAKIDEILAVVDDVINAATPLAHMDAEVVETARKKFVEVDWKRFGDGMERICMESTGDWLCGGKLSIADLLVYTVVDILKVMIFDPMSKDALEPYPRIVKCFEAVGKLPKVVEWNKAHAK
eukprot:Plantae.Rhodophyta-Hildenbrandia_rubra.ctg1297.p1 GENE.Plantae.Rhodophyta-Hildenbrandia_rubra.ctg1297~~Plantae.Rhodophyta-Hildenbrandia_rubra.ctg1297.p1  ORF type:complete len:212 (+),score=45.74 Plantae.Rhodophyta-Hildenbrandia_rubra.ctg1297:589-1224(+)